MNVSTRFTTRIDPVRQLIALDQSWDDPLTGLTPVDRRPLVEAIRLSVIFLPVAFFEDYLRELMSTFIAELNAQNPRPIWNKLPMQLRKTHVFDTETHIRRDPDTGSYDAHERQCLTELANVISKLTSPHTEPTLYEVVSEPFEGTNANPNSKQVNKMFNRVGLENVFAHSKLLSDLCQYDSKYSTAEVVRRQLDDIIELRHDVAHGRSIQAVSRQDLERNILFLEQLATCLNSLATEWLRDVLQAAR